MKIDIINLNDPKYSNLSYAQLALVRAAQVKKNKLLADAAAEKDELFRTLTGNHFARTTSYNFFCKRLDNETSAKISDLREDLELEIAYKSPGVEGNENGPYRYPQNPNYTLSYSERFIVVRDYYMDAVDEPNARLQAYSIDTLARSYLGDFYQTLYDLLASYC